MYPYVTINNTAMLVLRADFMERYKTSKMCVQ